MAKTKVYFWLKIDKKFFDNLFIKRLKNMPGGYTMTVIYIRLMLESLESDCILYYEGQLEDLEAELALKLDVSGDDIKMSLAYFTKCGVIQIDTDNNAEMTQAKALVQQETQWAKYKREQRKLDGVQNNLTLSKSCPTEIELELDKEIEIDIDLEQDKREAAGEKNIIFEKLKSAFGEMAINGTIVQETEDLLKVHGKTLLLFALDETTLNAGKSIRYTRKILENWAGRGLKTVEQVAKAKADYERARASKEGIKNNPKDNFPDLPF